VHGRVYICAILVIEKKEHNYLLDKERRLRCRSKLRTKELLKFQISCFLEFTKHHTLATFKVQTTNHTALSPTSRTATSINSLMYRHTPRSPLECSEKKHVYITNNPTLETISGTRNFPGPFLFDATKTRRRCLQVGRWWLVVVYE